MIFWRLAAVRIPVMPLEKLEYGRFGAKVHGPAGQEVAEINA